VLLGDLAEEYALRAHTDSSTAAAAWYLRESHGLPQSVLRYSPTSPPAPSSSSSIR